MDKAECLVSLRARRARVAREIAVIESTFWSKLTRGRQLVQLRRTFYALTAREMTLL